MKLSNLTILSYGAGQDSTAILLKLIHDQEFRSRYAPGELMVIMSDTGNEHPYTYEHVEFTKKLCEEHSIHFEMLDNSRGYHTEGWCDLVTPQLRKEGGKYKPTMVQLGTKSCTDNLKIKPIYKFLDEYLNEKFNYGFNVRKFRGCGKQALKKFHSENGKIRILIGFAKGEETRAHKSNKIQDKDYNSEADSWGKCLFREYPLIDIAMDRAACQKFITEKIGYCPMPSNCMLCPYQSEQELLWLYKNHRDQFETWIEIEANKLARYEGKTEKNHGVYNNKKTLRDKIESAQEKYGSWSDEDLANYKMSHGCQSNAM